MSRILFKKVGRAKFISHLDLMRTMQRAFIRAGVGIRHTEGFNPHPYMNFAMPLSVGTESLCELMDFKPQGELDLSALPERLNRTLPEGIEILAAYEETRKFKDIKWLDIEGKLFYDNKECEPEPLRELFGAETLVMEKRAKRGSAMTDIRPMIASIEFTAGEPGVLKLRARLSAQDPVLQPAQLLSAIAQKLPERSPDFAAFTRLELYDGNMEIFR